MSYESQAEPIKLGVLMDWVVPEDHPTGADRRFLSAVRALLTKV